MTRELRKQIEKAVKNFTIEDEGNEFDSLSDFEITKISRGVYSVSGTVLGTVYSSPKDSGSYYEPPTYDEYTVEAEVVLTVYTHRRDFDAEVELTDIDYDKDPE